MKPAGRHSGHLGSQIRNLRLEHGMTLQDLADAAGTSAPSIHRYEGGWTHFSLTTLRKIAEALNADLEIFEISCRTGEGLEAWFDWLIRQVNQRRAGGDGAET